ncbi:MAG: acyl-CoA thioesterase [Planctomycetes bacterium]|nr:acyl-CoA thioesterase [Planctomycetota bacterium]
MGVVYHARLLDWFEQGRTEFLRRVGPSYKVLEAQGVFLPVVKADLAYRVPLRYDDEVEVETRLVRLGAVTAEFRYLVRRVWDGASAAGGGTVHACVNARHRPTRFPLVLHQRLRNEV